ncbi:MAG: MarR family transcriptional regulator [Myxococcota bacterium]
MSMMTQAASLKRRISGSMLRTSQQQLLCSLIDLAEQDCVVPFWVRDIAPQLGIHATTLVRRLKILERSGLITRIRNTHHRAAVQLNVGALEHLPLRLGIEEATHG